MRGPSSRRSSRDHPCRSRRRREPTTLSAQREDRGHSTRARPSGCHLGAGPARRRPPASPRRRGAAGRRADGQGQIDVDENVGCSPTSSSPLPTPIRSTCQSSSAPRRPVYCSPPERSRRAAGCTRARVLRVHRPMGAGSRLAPGAGAEVLQGSRAWARARSSSTRLFITSPTAPSAAPPPHGQCRPSPGTTRPRPVPAARLKRANPTCTSRPPTRVTFLRFAATRQPVPESGEGPIPECPWSSSRARANSRGARATRSRSTECLR